MLTVCCREFNKLIIDYLQVEGYKEAALEFSKECKDLPPSIKETNLDLIQCRTNIRTAINNGDIDRAIALINEHNPSILDGNHRLFFGLLQQKLIEFIRYDRVEEALDFAQEELAPLAEENVRLTTFYLLTCVCSLSLWSNWSRQ